ncbi:ArdC family protein [Rhodoflexus caldus]|uniref:ArdC family protein n=1 Tax=Rhodoflexus caldus TaxID=2891236 RepID=UPI00202ABF36|nr:zincin-like metallopeptidase domain-containing protein [Rhodoflexus caldus]
MEKPKTDLYQEVTDKILSLLEQGVAPWRQTWKTSDVPRNFANKKPYTGINVWLLAMLPYERPLFLTYKQALQMGGQVRKGEKGHKVIFWKVTEAKDPQTGEMKQVFLLRYYTVFNVAQVAGIKELLPALPEPPSETQKTANCKAIINNMPNPPKLQHGGAQAYYMPLTDLVQMPPLTSFESKEAYFSTLFHEYAHATGHPKRLNRLEIATSGKSFFGSEDYSKEELTAELTASFLCNIAGIENARLIENSAAYIANWLQKLRNDKRMIITAAQQAKRATEYILANNITPTADDASPDESN